MSVALEVHVGGVVWCGAVWCGVVWCEEQMMKLRSA